MSTFKVAVITRTKNRPLLLERSIKSVLGQTFHDYVMVIINDGGDTRLVDNLIMKYQKDSGDRIQGIHYKESSGMEAASNAGIRQSKSKYIAMLDDDDTWHPDFLKETTDYLEMSNYKGVVTASEIIHEQITGNTFRVIRKERFAPNIHAIGLFSMSGTNQFPNNTFVYARDALESVGYYDESLPVLGDWEFNTRFIERYDIGYINKVLSYYHKREISTEANINTSIDTHLDYTARLLNKSLRGDLKKHELGLGVVANISHINHQMSAEIEKQRFGLDRLKEKMDYDHKYIHEKLQLMDEKLSKLDAKTNTSLGNRAKKSIKKAVSPLRRKNKN